MKNTFTKIVITLGPASSGKERIHALASAGANVFRMNFSHGDYETHSKNFKVIRTLSQKTGHHYGILADLQGPKLRVGNFKSGRVILKEGKKFRLDMDVKAGDDNRVSLLHPEIFSVLHPNMILLLNDGQIQLRVDDYGADYMNTTVIVGGELSDHKGVNVPGVVLPISALTDKDHKDLQFALKLGVDWVCLSFVQKPDDVIMARKIIGDRAGIIVKVEKPAALDAIDDIIDLADGIMVARGDLGVEMPVESVPSTQRMLIEKCRMAGKPVIVATQMLESMIHAPVPTRAEVSDVATAVYEGADAVMLSAETAVGAYPIQAVSMMKKITSKIQQDDYFKQSMERTSMPPDKTIASAITSSMVKMIRVLENPACIVTYSVSGKTAIRASRERPIIPILNMTTTEAVASKLALVWGVHSVVVQQLKGMSEVSPLAVEYVQKIGLAKSGEEVIVTAGIPFAQKGNTNILHVARVK
ncbi:MAG: pyruvate kinase [Lactobacillales bacterium]|jgi:pyruvate kinase|nr:pyruvate kinase [Lactobacillales bacterium]